MRCQVNDINATLQHHAAEGGVDTISVSISIEGAFISRIFELNEGALYIYDSMGPELDLMTIVNTNSDWPTVFQQMAAESGEEAGVFVATQARAYWNAAKPFQDRFQRETRPLLGKPPATATVGIRYIADNPLAAIFVANPAGPAETVVLSPMALEYGRDDLALYPWILSLPNQGIVSPAIIQDTAPRLAHVMSSFIDTLLTLGWTI